MQLVKTSVLAKDVAGHIRYVGALTSWCDLLSADGGGCHLHYH